MAVREAFGRAYSFGVIGTDDRFASYEMAIVPDDVGSVFYQGDAPDDERCGSVQRSLSVLLNERVLPEATQRFAGIVKVFQRHKRIVLHRHRREHTSAARDRRV